MHGDGDSVARYAIDDDFDLLRTRRDTRRHLHIHLIQPNESWGQAGEAHLGR